MLLYSTLYLTGYGLDARRPQELPPARLADRRPPRVRPRAGHRDHDRAARPGHRERASAWRSAERMLAARFNRDGPRDRRPLHLRDRLRRRPAGGRRVRGVLARRPPRPRPPDRASTTTTTSRSRATPRCRSPRTSARATRPTAGTSRTSARTSTLDRIEARGRRARRRRRPAVADRRPHAHRARARRTSRTPHGAHGAPLGEEEIKLTKEAYGWPTDEPFFVPDEALEHFRECRRRAARSSRPSGASASSAYRGEHPGAGRGVRAACSRASCPRAGTPTCRRKGPDAGMIATRKASQRRDPVGGRRRCPSWSAARPTSRPRR